MFNAFINGRVKERDKASKHYFRKMANRPPPLIRTTSNASSINPLDSAVSFQTTSEDTIAQIILPTRSLLNQKSLQAWQNTTGLLSAVAKASQSQSILAASIKSFVSSADPVLSSIDACVSRMEREEEKLVFGRSQVFEGFRKLGEDVYEKVKLEYMVVEDAPHV